MASPVTICLLNGTQVSPARRFKRKMIPLYSYSGSFMLLLGILVWATTTGSVPSVSAVLNRRLTTSVSAPSWPTLPQSAICETFAYFSVAKEESTSVSDSDTKSGKQDTVSSYLILSEMLRRIQHHPLSSFADGVELAVETVRDLYPNASSIHETLLPLELSLRAHAPFCEMHRSLARQALSSIDASVMSNNKTALDAFVVFQLPRLVYASSIPDLQHILSSLSLETEEIRKNPNNDNIQPWAQTLPNEFVYDPSLNTSAASFAVTSMPTALLYGFADSTLFATFFQYLQQAAIPFVVRFMGHVHYEEEEVVVASNPSPTTTYLQGYGVRLDIRNVEYTAFDNTFSSTAPMNHDTAGTPFDKEEAMQSIMDKLSPLLNLQHFVLHHSTIVNETIVADSSDLFTLYPLFINQAQKIPPKAQWKDLALQATTVIATWTYPQDPLWTLQELAQNLPSHASSLVQVKVPPHLQQAAVRVNQLLGITPSNSMLRSLLHSKKNLEGFFELYINGRKVSLQSPTFNIFHLLHVLREEDQSLTHMYQTLGPFLPATNLEEDTNATTTRHLVFEILSKWMAMGKEEFERQVQQKDVANTMETEDDMDHFSQLQNLDDSTRDAPFRIDVGHGYRGAVMYLNDIEKDDVYKNWPRSVSQMVMAMQFQSAPRIRRNMLTVLLVVDPSTTDMSDANDISMTIQMLLTMAQSGFPLRIGLLLVHDEDVLDCKKQLQDSLDRSCQVPGPFTSSSKDSKSDMDLPSTTHTALLLTQHALKSYDGFFALQYVGKMMEDLSNAIEEDENITLKHLIDFHVSIMSMIDVAPEDARSEIVSLLSSNNESLLSGDISYANAISFAARKNIESGFAFVNGRPVPLSDPRDIQTVLMEELHYITELIQLGRITDSKPRSVYGYLLSEERVYPKMHPLLAESNKGVYEIVHHDFNHLSTVTTLKSPSQKVKDLDSIYLLEIGLDLDSENGIDFALSCLSSLDSLREKIQTEKKYGRMAVAVRFIPSNTSAADGDSVGMILRCAGLLKVDEFHTFLLLQKNALKTGEALDIEEIVDIMAKIKTNINCSKKSNVRKSSHRSNYISINGRYYAPFDDDVLSVDDFEILLDLEKKRSRAVTQELKTLVPEDQIFDIIGRVAAFFGQYFSIDKAQRKDVDLFLKRARSDSSIEPLLFSWNQEKDKIKVVCLLDPLTEAAQRATPILRIIRDSLQLPLTVVLVPRLEIHEDSHVPISSYYRFVSLPDAYLSASPIQASFEFLPTNHLLTLRMDVPESWDVQQSKSIQDTDNLRCDVQGCGDSAFSTGDNSFEQHHALSRAISQDLTHVEYGLKSLLFFGQCLDVSVGSPPNGLQLTLSRMLLGNNASYTRSKDSGKYEQLQILPDGSLVTNAVIADSESVGTSLRPHSDTLVMKTLGYWQLRANPGVWKLEIASHSRGAEIFEITDGAIDSSGAVMMKSQSDIIPSTHRILVMKDYVSKYQPLLVRRKQGFEDAELFNAIGDVRDKSDDDTVHVFSLATGHLYERFLKIMMLSVTKRTSTRVKFWLFENYLSPGFKASAKYMADRIGCEVEFVTYKWPEWLRGQSEKQRIIWGYKILFLDVLFPLNLKKIIYVDADQVVRSDLKELWDLDLQGAPYGYTPFCDSRESTLGYQFWRNGFWKDHLDGKPYHISALYVVDLERFRKELVGDHLRAVYQQLSADSSSLSNLDQDLPNYAQDMIKIHSLPQEWLWCESWCSDETKATAKTIDLCNNPEHKEPKLSMAKRIISGPLFQESWIELDHEVDSYDNEYIMTQRARDVTK